MEALVHLDPSRCVCVLGPQVSAQYLVATGLDPTAIPAVMSHRGLVEAGIRKFVDVESFESIEAKQRKETLLRSAYELDPTFPAYKVTEKLRELGVYEQWLAEAFAPVSSRPTMLGYHATLEHLTSLQRQGLLLAYSHYDPVLLNTQRFKPVLMDSEEGVREWATSVSGRHVSSTSGLLCIHGSLAAPSSLRWDSVAYCSEVGDSPGGRMLKEVCKTRYVIFFGFDADFFDPLLQKFCTTFLPTPIQTPPLLLSTQPGRQSLLPSVLTLRVGQLALEKVLIPVPTSQQGMYMYTHTWCVCLAAGVPYMQAVELVNACSVIASFLACCRHSARLASTASEAVFVPTVIFLWKTADLVLRFWSQQRYGMCMLLC